MRVGLAQCAGSELLTESLHDLFMETSSRDLGGGDGWGAGTGHLARTFRARTNGRLDELELASFAREEAEALVKQPKPFQILTLTMS